MLRGAALGWSTGRRSLGEAPARGNWLPARSRDLALQLARGRGSPPLRFASTRGPPSSTNTSEDVYGKASCRAVSRSERAATRQTDSIQQSIDETAEGRDAGVFRGACTGRQTGM